MKDSKREIGGVGVWSFEKMLRLKCVELASVLQFS